MSIEVPEMFKQFGKGLVAQMAPEIAKGALVEILRTKKVDFKKATEWVESNSSLWETLGLVYQERLKLLASKAGNLDFMDADWAISAMKGEFPAVASLFLGWRKAHNWLERQAAIIRKEVVEQS